SGHALLALGSYQEYHPEAIKKADKIVVDHVEQALHRGAIKPLSERGEITAKNIHATIGEIIAGRKSGRTNGDEVIFFVPIGMGMLDIAVADIAYKRALEKGRGSYFEFRR
ncbi:MAG: ornithine cyclodeaminase family protein, partial [Candidatus Bathyarchaeia archaeon]